MTWRRILPRMADAAAEATVATEAGIAVSAGRRLWLTFFMDNFFWTAATRLVMAAEVGV
jgi:hypothetical protein